MAQLNYNEYKKKALGYLREQISKMERILKGSDEEFDGRSVSIFARLVGEDSYPDPNKVTYLIKDLQGAWNTAKTKNASLSAFTVNVSSEVGHSGYPQVMVQIYKIG